MGKAFGIAAILLCAFAVLIACARHPNAVRKWLVKLGLQATRSDRWEKFVPAGKVLRHEPPYDFGEELQHYDWLADAMEEEVKRSSRDYDTVGYARFRAGVTSSVLRGLPLLWSVERLFPWDRKDESSGAGHMRLIVGYNLQTDEILYSDSWGSGHEFKRATFAEAWRETDFMSCLQPLEP